MTHVHRNCLRNRRVGAFSRTAGFQSPSWLQKGSCPKKKAKMAILRAVDPPPVSHSPHPPLRKMILPFMFATIFYHRSSCFRFWVHFSTFLSLELQPTELHPSSGPASCVFSRANSFETPPYDLFHIEKQNERRTEKFSELLRCTSQRKFGDHPLLKSLFRVLPSSSNVLACNVPGLVASADLTLIVVSNNMEALAVFILVACSGSITTTTVQRRSQPEKSDHELKIRVWKVSQIEYLDLCQRLHLRSPQHANLGGICCDGRWEVFSPVSSEGLRASMAYF